MKFVYDHYNQKRLEETLNVDTQDLAFQVDNIMESPQQLQGSLDCGVILCEVMARIVRHDQIANSCDTIALRSAMVHEFLNTPGRSYTKEAYEALKVARTFL